MRQLSFNFDHNINYSRDDSRKPFYISVDIETDGPTPGKHSMLSIGAAAFDKHGNLVDTFTVNLQPLFGADTCPATMAFWAKFPDAYEATKKDRMKPYDAMAVFQSWILRFGRKPTMVAYPAGFDFSWIYYYFMTYLNRSPFGFVCFDMKTYASVLLNVPFHKVKKAIFPKSWYRHIVNTHSHVAIDDAIEQGLLYFEMRNHEKMLHEAKK